MKNPKNSPAFILAVLMLTSFLISGCAGSGEGTVSDKAISVGEASVSDEAVISRNVVIPGLTKSYDFLFLTDTHIIVPDGGEGEQVRDYTAQRLPVFQNTEDSASVPQLTDWIAYADRQKYDGLLLGGDIIDFPSSANLKYLDSALQALTVPYLYTLGNHDWTYPWEYMTEAGKDTCLPLLAPYMDGNTAIHTLEFDEFILAAVDNSGNQINPDALEDYKEILTKGKPVIVLLHVPLYTESLLAQSKKVWKNGVVLGGGVHGGIYPDPVSAEFLRLTLAKSSPVAAVLAGHVHFAARSMLQGEKSIPQITGDAGYKGRGTVVHLSGA